MGGGSGRAGLLSHRCGELGPPALVQMSHRISVVIVTASAASNPPALASLTILLGPVMADTTQAATQWGCGVAALEGGYGFGGGQCSMRLVHAEKEKLYAFKSNLHAGFACRLRPCRCLASTVVAGAAGASLQL